MSKLLILQKTPKSCIINYQPLTCFGPVSASFSQVDSVRTTQRVRYHSTFLIKIVINILEITEKVGCVRLLMFSMTRFNI